MVIKLKSRTAGTARLKIEAGVGGISMSEKTTSSYHAYRLSGPDGN
jgi:hypothetical protein